MGITKIGNVILPVADLDVSLRFYSDVLGLEVKMVIPGDFAFLDGKSTTLALRQARKGDVLKCNDEVSFDTDDVMATYRLLASKGVQFSRPPRPGTSDGKSDLYATDFLDPDSHLLSITGWVPKEARVVPDGKAED